MFKARGFTLVELMIVVIIIGIIGSFAYPSYLDSSRKAKRTSAKQVVLEAVARQETYRAQTLGYGRDMLNLGYGANPYVTADGLYSVAVSSATPATGRVTAFTITATALGDQVNDSCDGFGMDSVGNKTVTKGSVENCW